MNDIVVTMPSIRLMSKNLNNSIQTKNVSSFFLNFFYFLIQSKRKQLDFSKYKKGLKFYCSNKIKKINIKCGVIIEYIWLVHV